MTKIFAWERHAVVGGRVYRTASPVETIADCDDASDAEMIVAALNDKAAVAMQHVVPASDQVQ